MSKHPINGMSTMQDLINRLELWSSHLPEISSGDAGITHDKAVRLAEAMMTDSKHYMHKKLAKFPDSLI